MSLFKPSTWFKSTPKNMANFWEPSVPFKTATLAHGCFWSEGRFGVVDGVIHTKVGYIGGTKVNPTYRNIMDYSEASEYDFDPTAISYKGMLDIFWSCHDARDKYKKQYMSAIFYHDDEQKTIAEQSKAERETAAGVPMATLILPATTFYNAEDYHQKYRLRGHSEFLYQLGLDDKRIISTHIAARLNGWLGGYGENGQIDKEYKKLGLTDEQGAYVKKVNAKTTPHC